MEYKPYPVRTFENLRGLNGIPDAQIEVHLELYEGYVKNANKLSEQIAEMFHEKRTKEPSYSELVRRLGWEDNGMRLHELYFENLNASGRPLHEVPALQQKLEQDFSTVEDWKAHFHAVSEVRGIGWCILYQDPDAKVLSVHFVEDHHIGHPAGFKPILVMDLWEHAFSVYLKPTERAQYIEDFLSNVDWGVSGRRLIR